MIKRIFLGFALIPYFVAYFAARDAHWVIHSTSYGYHCHDSGTWEPLIVSHGVRGGDYAFISPLLFTPVRWLETAAWYVLEPVNTPFVGYVGPPPMISSSKCTKRLLEQKR